MWTTIAVVISVALGGWGLFKLGYQLGFIDGEYKVRKENYHE